MVTNAKRASWLGSHGGRVIALSVGLLLTMASCSAKSTVPNGETSLGDAVPEITSTTQTIAEVPTTTSTATSMATTPDPIDVIAAGLDETLAGSFVYELNLDSSVTSRPSVLGLRNAEDGYVLEAWSARKLFGAFVGEGIQAIGRPDQLSEFVGFHNEEADWAWLQIPDELDGLFHVDHPPPHEDPVFRYDSMLRDLVAAATSVAEARSGALSTTEGLVVVTRWELVVPAWTLMPAVGTGSENSWYVDQGDAPDLDIPVTIGLDEDGRFRELTVDSGEFAIHVDERFGITGNRAGGDFTFEIVIKSFDVEAFPIGHLGVPTEAMRVIDADDYLSGRDRPVAGSCVGTYGELSLPMFERPRTCEYGIVALGPLPGSADDEFPGYTSLWTEALDGCVSLAGDLLGDLDERGITVHYSLASPALWDIGEDPVMCGASFGWR